MAANKFSDWRLSAASALVFASGLSLIFLYVDSEWVGRAAVVLGLPGLFAAILLAGSGFHGNMPEWYWMVVGTIINAALYTPVLWVIVRGFRMAPASAEATEARRRA